MALGSFHQTLLRRGILDDALPATSSSEEAGKTSMRSIDSGRYPAMLSAVVEAAPFPHITSIATYRSKYRRRFGEDSFMAPLPATGMLQT